MEVSNLIDSVNLFDGHIPYYKITKPVRLIELFAGIGSQHQALKNLGVKIDRSTIVEWQVNSIQAYNDIHVRKYDDWTQGITKEELAYRLNELGVSLDYNQPAKLETLLRKGEEWLRNVYNNIINTNNKVNIMSVKASHLNIVDTDKYDYIMTYSFPCQDLSKAGLRKGMSDTTTRSGLLWEVERILSECDQLPQILLMENVPDVIGSKFIKDFQRWEERLRKLGYSNHTEILNSKDYGIPQNRERAFMVSILGEHLYNFPQKQPLKLRLKDMLEKEVDEKYYLSHNLIHFFYEHTEKQKEKGNGFAFKPTNGDGLAKCVTTRSGQRPDDNFISQDKRLPEMLDKIDFNTDEPQSLDLYNRTVSDISQTLTMPNHNAQAIAVKETKEFANYITWEDDKGRLNTQDHRAYFEDRLSGTIPAIERGVPNVLLNNEPSIAIPEDTKQGYALAHDGDGVYTNRPQQKRGVVQKQMIQTIKTSSDDIGVVVNEPKVNIVGNYSPSNHNASSIVDSNGIAPTVMENHGTITATVVKEYSDYSLQKIKGNLVDTNDVVGTITANAMQSLNHDNCHIVKHNLRIRKLTPRECYRLMGFSDQAFDLAQPNQSNSSLYHQAGDSIVVNVLMAIFKELL